MAETSAIEWTDATWNPWYGCTKVSPGCAHCYMFREMKQYGRDPELVTRSKTKFHDPLKWQEPRTIFTCSWSDWFHEAADEWRPEAWQVIRQTPQHTYQMLTKRPERIAEHLPWDWEPETYPNVWLGVSVENQRHIGRATILCSTPAAVRFISAEPLLGRVDLTGYLGGPRCSGPIHWVVAGGESGPRHRPMALNWARLLRDQCTSSGVAFFLKQLGGWPNKRGGDQAVLDGRTWTEMPARARNLVDNPTSRHWPETEVIR